MKTMILLLNFTMLMAACATYTDMPAPVPAPKSAEELCNECLCYDNPNQDGANCGGVCPHDDHGRSLVSGVVGNCK